MRTLAQVIIATVASVIAPLGAHADSKCQSTETAFAFGQTSAGPLKVHVFSPVNFAKAPQPAIVIFHGGGWTIGEPSWAFGLVDRYVCKGLVTIIPQYRLSGPKTATPADAIDDAMAAIKWTRAHASKLNIDPKRVAVLGWSAGAHLAASAAIFAKDNV